MAVIQAGKTVQPTTINKFLGLNLSDTGDTQIQLGESGNMTNFYITDDLKLRKMHGYKSFYTFSNPVTGLFSAKINNSKSLFVTVAGPSGGQLYKFDENALIDSNVNPEKSQLFTTDGETDEYNLQHTGITSIEELKIGKSKITEFDIDENIYSFDSTTVGDITYPGGEIDINAGTITFNSVPSESINVVVKYIKYLEPIEIPLDGGGHIGSDAASFFEFDNKLYILCGGYYKYDGTTLSEVEGYIPTVFINTPAGINGGGVIYEEINMLTPFKKQTFNGDGTTTKFKIAQEYVDDIVYVTVNGESVQYNPNLETGIVTCTNAPAQGYDNVEITWYKEDNDRDIIENMRFGTIFGGDVDTRVFLYGNTDDEQQNRVYFSGITYENDIAVPSVEYFPATAHIDIGPKNFAVTDLTRQYDRLLATTNKPEAYYLTISTEQLPVTLGDGSSTTRYVPAVSTFPLNEVHGNVAPGQGRVLDNNPVTFEDGTIIQWKSTNVRDERNMEVISQKVKLDLDKISMSTIKTLDLQEYNQLWVMATSSGKTKVWLYNYSNKTFSRLELPDIMNELWSLNGEVFMTSVDGKIVKFSKAFSTYGNNPTSLDQDPDAINEKIKIKAYWEMNFSDFGVPYLRKTMGKLWVSLQPQNWTTCEVSFISNRVVSTIKKEIEYTKQWFDNVDFGDWHFTSSVNPQPFRLKLKAKKFTNMKITIRNEEKSACTVLSLVLQVESFGYSK